MKKLGFCIVLTGVVCLGLMTALVSVSNLSARPACGGCTCLPTEHSTPMVWGHGPTCSDAFDDAVAQARTHISCSDGVCFEGVVVDNACAPSGGAYMIDLHIVYRCYDCTTLCLEAEQVAQ
ncbi:MAG: hypothetical protein V3T83_10985 [Acidobacteriota bacterium]